MLVLQHPACLRTGCHAVTQLRNGKTRRQGPRLLPSGFPGSPSTSVGVIVSGVDNAQPGADEIAMFPHVEQILTGHEQTSAII